MRKQQPRKKYLFKTIFLIFLIALCVNGVIYNYSMAEQSRNTYVGDYEKCLRESGGHENIPSVRNYACGIASSRAINVCASWIGASDGSTSTKIYATGISFDQIADSTTVSIKIWGMCTAVADTSRNMATAPPNIVTCGGSPSCNFTRSGNWGHPSSIEGKLNVSKFISGRTPEVSGEYYVYSRKMAVTRTHSDGKSSNTDYTDISLYISKPTTPTPSGGGGGGGGCTTEDPDTSLRGETYNGTLSIDVTAENSRIGWSNKKVYARPDDKVVWHNDYRATTPGAADIKVAELEGAGGYKGFQELSSVMCQPNGGLCARRLDVEKKKLSDLVEPWQNQFSAFYSWNDQESVHNHYSYNQNVYGTYSDYNAQDEKIISRTEDVGKTLTVTTKAGTYSNRWGSKSGLPSKVDIDYYNPSKEVYQEVCEEKEVGTIYYGIKKGTNEEGWFEKFDNEINLDGSSGTDPSSFFEPNSWTSSTLYEYPCENKKVCTNSYKEAITRAKVEQNEVSNDASVDVPYNYKNYTGVVINSPYIYAGETVTVDRIMMDVGPKYNGATQDTYATKVPYATTRLFAYASDSSNGRGATSNYTISWSSDGCAMIGGAAKDGQCVEMPSLHTIYTLNSAGNLGLYEDYYNSLSYEDKRWANRYDYENNYRVYSGYLGERTYNAFDIAAGDYMCFVAAIYPASSGSDYQMGIQGDEMWRYSEPKCVVIAKRPTFQVWGGDVYSVNNIKATPAAKNNIYMDYTWPSGTFNSTRFNTERRNTTYFGSWSEQGITIRDGVTSTVASGAATGYARPNYVVKAGNTGTFCKERVPLTFANYPCTLGEVGRSAIPSGVSDNREDLLKYWLGNNLGETVEKIKNSERNNWTEITTDGGSRVEYIHVGADYTIRDNIIAKGSTRLLISDGSINIIENLTIPSGLTNSKEIPKLIILADNINIRCTVNEIDAILITRKNGTVNTCINATKDNDNDVKRSNQLKIFGTVITDMLVLGRTYGGGATKTLEVFSTDAETRAVPNEDRAAEIFDFDPTILLWGEAKSSTAETSTLQETHQRELAPRY